MARYKEKDVTDLSWNRIRRRITRELDTHIQDFREELLNKLLVDAWDKYVASLETGTLVELEAESAAFVARLMDEIVRPVVVVEK